MKTKNPNRSLYASPSRLDAKSRTRLAAALDQCLSEGLDLHGQIKVAHWNIKGPHFATLHPLFETFAVGLAGFNDEIAERAVTLGAVVHGTARDVSARSRLAAWPQDAARDLELVQLLVERIQGYLAGLRDARTLSDELGDLDTSDLLTEVLSTFEKHAWFLHATLA